MRDREVYGIVGIGDRVELLITVLDTEQNLGGIFLVRRRYLDSLEAALERSVLLDRLAILAWGGSPDALNFAA